MAGGDARREGRRPRVVVYVDSTTLGGHEITTGEVVETIANSGRFDVVFMCAIDALRDRLSAVVPCERTPARNRLPLPWLRNLRPLAILRTARRFQQLRADLVIVAQGNIEIGLIGLIAARLARVRVVSYIPLAFTFRESGAPLAAIRDVVDRLYYRLPNAFITVTSYQAELLRRFSSVAAYVVRSPMRSRETGNPPMRVRLDDRNAPIRVAVIGRIFFRQKHQDVLPAVARRLMSSGEPVVFDVIGDGPDRDELEQLARDTSTQGVLSVHGWLPREVVRERLRTATDVVLVPSWFEGMPMVLVEALGTGRTIIASDRPFIREYELPAHYLVDPADPGDIAARIASVAHAGEPKDLARVADHVLALHAPEAFRNSLVTAVEREVLVKR